MSAISRSLLFRARLTRHILGYVNKSHISQCQSKAGGSSGSTVPAKILKYQKHFQEPKTQNVPIFLRGGLKDKLLYRLTITLALVGLCGDVGLYLHYIID